MKPIIDFFKEIRGAIASNTLPYDCGEVIEKAIKLGVNPSDLLIGIVQPLLWEIGERVKRKEVTVTQEHEFSKFTNDLVEELIRNYDLKQKDLVKNQVKSDIYLICCEGNYHYLGLRFIELFLRQEKMSVRSVFPSVPFQEIMNIDQKYKPKMIGISVMQQEQFNSLKSYLESLGDEKRFYSTLLVGGQGVEPHASIQHPDVVIYDKKIESLIDLIRSRMSVLAA